MTEDEFWGALEFRICREIHGVDEWKKLGLWCDGVIPEQYNLSASPSQISGRIWFDFGHRGQDLFRFTLLLARQYPSRDAIGWEELMPPEDVTRWLTIDLDAEQVIIEPAVAVPDSTLD